MLDDILINYKDNDYVYIIDGCTDWYASLTPSDFEECPMCGEISWPITEGYVRDLKRINTLEELKTFEEIRIENLNKKTRFRK